VFFSPASAVRALNIIVEAEYFVAVVSQVMEGVCAFPVLKMDAAILEGVLDCLYEPIYQRFCQIDISKRGLCVTRSRSIACLE
jgi:hypothetical protein